MAKVSDHIIGKWERKVNGLAQETGYEFYFLWAMWMEVLLERDPDESVTEKWNYFESVTRERDW